VLADHHGIENFEDVADFIYLLEANPGYLPIANGIRITHQECEGTLEFRWNGKDRL